ncbi:non-ribosomal peptide synthetase/type I polyketide synthase [uncultured Tenacibaculum sp.]|uniref:non-ribosomal peptide synthetase/type I polyketide synthase n=1 Tax=uncultured Tenacibaculum sp. TaxID=174713 RepID=UPI00262A80C1|nr:non-ribosomal peptide synthetase/type I polyketide synthase [uncultured Tenacibaculum sp.]
MIEQKYTGLEIAVVGMACRLPGASNPQEFWENLKLGKESISRFSEEELLKNGTSEKEFSNANFVNAKGIIKDVEFFDNSFFGISNTEADILDPQIRLLLQCAYNGLEDANYDFNQNNNNTGVFVGGSPNVSWQTRCFQKAGNLHSEQFSSLIANDKDFLSTRLSYLLNLHGHSQTVYTACSTSLVAIDMACQSLLTGKCDVTIAGGVSLTLPNKSGYTSESGLFMSKDGHTRSFDVNATGTIWSDGVGVVVLKRLEDAIADGDNIHAVIKGSASNNDGNRKIGYTAPSIKGQTDVIGKAIKMAEIEKESVTYIEGHGSATTLGDKIEVSALSEAFGDTNKDFSCAIGSIKSNIGHLNVAAGIAGFIKVCLMLKNNTIAPSLNFETPNQQLKDSNVPFFVNSEAIEWKNSKYPLRAGINSFGIGGTNVHMILEKAPENRKTKQKEKHSVICLSANSSSDLDKLSKNLVDFVKENKEINIADLAYTLQKGRQPLRYRKAIVAKNTEELIEELTKEKLIREVKEKPEIIFAFPGMGGFYPLMGKDLYSKEKVFRSAMDDCFSIVKNKTGKDLNKIMYDSKDLGEAKDFQNSQLMVFIFEYAIASLLKSWGIKANANVGYSLGEYVAACASDIFNLTDALEILIERGKLMCTLDSGGMIAASLTKKEVQKYLSDGVSIAINNGKTVVLGGKKKSLDKVSKKLRDDDVLVFDILDRMAGHTSEMNPIRREFEKRVSKFKMNQPVLPIVSNVTGNWESEEFTSGSYWGKHLAEEIDFQEVIKTLVTKKPEAIYLEVGVGNFLGALLGHQMNSKEDLKHIGLARSENKLQNDNEQGVSDHTHLMKSIASIWEFGGDIDWELFNEEERQKISLPAYPFKGQEFDLDIKKYSLAINTTTNKERSKDMSSWFYIPSWKKKPLSLDNDQLQKSKRNILLLDFNNSDELSTLLKVQGHTVVQVKNAQNYKKQSSTSFLVDFSKQENILTLLKELEKEKVIIDSIIDLTSIESKYENASLQRTITFIQNINKTSYGSEKLEYFIISNNLFTVYGNENINPVKSGLISLSKIVTQENLNINCRLIEIDEEAYENKSSKFYKFINHELNSKDKIVSYKGKSRWNQFFESYPIKNSESKKSYIENNGTYIIVGGLGDVGFTIAQYILENFESNVVLVGRSEIPKEEEWKQWIKENGVDNKISKKINRLSRLKDVKGEVTVMQADSTDESQMQLLFKEVIAKNGSVDGVFYSVGDIDGESFDLVNTMTEEQMDYHLPMKIKGLNVLKRLVDQESIDFVAVMSSFTSVLGGLGMLGYAVSNQFVDSFVNKEMTQSDSTIWKSFNFSYWNMEGDGADYQERSFLKMEKMGDDISNTAIKVDEGKLVFERLLSINNIEEQIIVSPVNFPYLVDKFESVTMQIENEEIEVKSVESRKTDIEYVAPVTEKEKELAKIWEELFGFQVGVLDDFFQLGGDSLGIIKLISKIKKKFNINIDIREVFKNTSFDYQLNLINNEDQDNFIEIESAPIQEYYPQSDAQKRFFILNQMSPDILTYNQPTVLEIEGELDVDFCKEVFQRIIDEHEVLRTSFHFIDGNPVQKIHKNAPFEIGTLEGKRSEIESIVKCFQTPFDLSKPTQLKASICKIGPSNFYLIMDVHHIIVDRATLGLVMEDFVKLYNKEKIKGSEITYKDFAVWQQKSDYLNELNEQKEFWLNEFKTIPESINLPIDFPRSDIKNFNADTLTFDLTDSQSSRLKEICLEQQTTMFTLLLSAFHILLSKLSNQEDIVVGSSILGRQRSDVEDILGVFVNTLSLRSSVTSEEGFKDYLNNFKGNVMQCFANQGYPFEKLIEELGISPKSMRNPLIDVMFEYFSFEPTETNFPDFEIKDTLLFNNTTDFDLTLKAEVKENGRHEFSLEYRTDLFKRETIERFAENYKNVITSIIENIDVKLSNINVLTAEEEHKLLNVFNSTNLEYDKNESLVSIFKKNVKKFPDRIAVSYEGKSLTYKELDERSNKVANYLILEDAAHSVVGLLIERSIDMIVGMWGVLKVGAGYLPLDPTLPEQRIRYMLDKSRATFLLSHDHYLEAYSAYLPVQSIDSEEVSLQSSEGVNFETESKDLAYCIFTSGSTGKPKGVMINHSNVINLVKGLEERVYSSYNKEEGLRVALLASYAFDASAQQIFGALLQGNSLYVASDESRKDGEKLLSFYNENKIEISDGTPTHFRLLLNSLNKESKLENLSSWLLAGEVLPKDLVHLFYNTIGEDIQLYNFYGPTETCVDSTCYKVDVKQLESLNSVPIGKPLPNERVYVTDRLGKLVPMGVVGELCIAGEGLASRYVGNQSLTFEKFNSDWIDYEDRVYRTGDMVRWLENGDLEYHGREDNQVKIRGFRIELGEIQEQLNAYSKIQHSVVVIKESEDEKYLVAYYQSESEIDVSKIRKHLSKYLPDYMIPNYYVHLADFDINVNGKIDYQALPEYKLIDNEEFVGPVNKIEEKLIDLFSEILSIDDTNQIGRKANFIDLGGHSLKMVFLANSINKEFKVKISLKEVMENSTVMDLGSLISRLAKVDHLEIPVSKSMEFYPLSTAQKRMYFAHQLDKKSIAYNAPVITTFKGGIDIDRLEDSFKKLIDRHESLRTIFLTESGNLVQRILPEIEFSLEFLEKENFTDKAIKDFIKPFDLEKGPLLRTGVIEISEEEHVVVMDFHHIISDEVTCHIFIKDLISLYKGEELSELRVQYKDYTVWLEQEEQQKEIERQKGYWLNKFSKDLDVLELPYDFPRSSKDNDKGGNFIKRVNPSKVEQLKEIAKSEGVTMYGLFLSMFKVLLYKLSNQQDIIVGTPVAARPHIDLESITGVFINTLPIRNNVNGQITFKDFVKQIKEGCTVDLDNQLYPYEDLVDELQIDRDSNRNPLFDVSFNFMKQDWNLLHIPGISIEPYTMEYSASKFDLSMIIIEKGGEMNIHLEYAKLLFKEKTIERFMNYFDNIIDVVCDNITVKVSDIEIIEKKESQLLNSFSLMNDLQQEENTIVKVFEKQVKTTPAAIALKYAEKSYTYESLNQKVNQLARSLRENYGIKKGEIVGVLLPKSDDAVISILAILKLGAAYLPIDTKYPIERINYIIENSGLRGLVSNTNKSDVGISTECFINYELLNFESNDTNNLNYDISSEDLAYVIYTSGSTGKPKGVMIEHGSNVNMSTDIVKQLNVNDRDAILWFASIAFDASVYEIMMALYSGATLVIPEEGVINDITRFCELATESKTTILTLPPSYLETLPLDELSTLRVITTAGEAANAKKALEVIKTGIRYFNAYGPTECAVCTSIYEVFRGDAGLINIPIGKPIANTEMIVLDENLKQVPMRVKGTIFIAGKGVSRGYVNNPELTNQSFVNITINGIEKRFYNSGDIGEWTENGVIIFHGRKDNQIKLRGYRIELGEIEGALSVINGVRNNHVIVKQIEGKKELVGFLILDKDLKESYIEDELTKSIPDYMIPRSWVKLDKFPLTINGKINTKELLNFIDNEEEVYVAPENDVEKKLVEIWAEILNMNVSEVGVLDDFFMLGGNSLIAIQMITQINKNYGIQLELQEVFKLKTIRGISELIRIDLWVSDEDKNHIEYDEAII